VQNKPIAHKYTLFLAIGIVLIIAVMIVTKPEPKLEQRELPPLQVSVTQAKARDIQPRRQVGGLLQPAQQARLQFRVDGRVAAQLVEPGQTVTKGDEILRLEDDDLRDSKQEAEARLTQEKAAVARDTKLLELAKRNVELQQTEVERQQQLETKSLASRTSQESAQQRLIQLQTELEQLKYAVASGNARIEIQQAATNRAIRNWQRSRLTAPFSGIVNQVMVKAGDDIAAKDVVIELIDTTQLEFYTEVEEATAAQLQLGQEIELTVDGNNYGATIIALQRHPDPKTYTYELRARMANPGLLPGGPAEANLLMPILKDAVIVPVSAVVHDDGQSYLFVVQNNILKKQPVVLGVRQDDLQVIKQGLTAGETIISAGGAGLSDGLKVAY